MQIPRAVLGRTPFAVVDVETTGVFPGKHDRVIEVAILRLSPDARVEEEYVTLVNPRRDVGRTDIHGIGAGELLHAPDFSEVAGDIGSRLQGAIVAGHNVRFDLGFLHAEYALLGCEMPAFPALCTLQLAYRFDDEPSRSLVECCRTAGIVHDAPHTALGDAQATAALLSHYWRMAALGCACGLGDLGCESDMLADPSWLRFAPTGRAVRRSDASLERSRERGYLSRLVSRLPGREGSCLREAEYLCLLDRVLEDRLLTRAEAESLCAAAQAWAMAQNDVAGAHHAYVWALARQAKADGVVTEIERRDLRLVCELLGVADETLARILDAPASASPPSSQEVAVGALAGLRVCFTGEMLGNICGERATRAMAEDHARRAGMLVQPRVTKGLDILVVADPETQSGKARQAREYGIRILAEAAFWGAIGVRVD